MRIISLIGTTPAKPLDDMNYAISGNDGVHDTVMDYTNESAQRAERSLAQHRHDGDSKITVTEGEVDGFVNLDDTAGDMAAYAIEFGRKGADGLYIITKAAGLVR